MLRTLILAVVSISIISLFGCVSPPPTSKIIFAEPFDGVEYQDGFVIFKTDVLRRKNICVPSYSVEQIRDKNNGSETVRIKDSFIAVFTHLDKNNAIVSSKQKTELQMYCIDKKTTSLFSEYIKSLVNHRKIYQLNDNFWGTGEIFKTFM